MPPFCFRFRINPSVGYSVYQSQIATATVLVETAVQKQVNNKIQEATFFIKVHAGGNPFCKESKMSYHSSILERKQMLIKYSNVYQTKDKDASVLINMVYTLSFMVVMPHLPKQIRQRKKFKTDNPEAWL
jgi:hypothetical protein